MFLIYAGIMVIFYWLLFASRFFFQLELKLIWVVVIAAIIIGIITTVIYNILTKHSLKLWHLIIVLPLTAFVMYFIALFIFAIYFVHPLTDWKLQQVAKSITVESVTEVPYFFEGTQIGLRVTTDVRLSKEITFDQYGLAVVEALNKSMLITPQGPFELHGYFSSTTFNGESFDSLTTKIGYKGFIIGKEKTYYDSNPKVSLPVGVYKLSKVFLLNGVFFLDRNQTENSESKNSLCKHYLLSDNFDMIDSKENYDKQVSEILQKTAAAPWEIVISGRITSRMSGLYYLAKSFPIKYRYDNVKWRTTLDSLNLPACRTLMKKAKESAQFKKDKETENVRP